MTRLSFLLADLPVAILEWLRCDRVMQLSAAPPEPHTRGRPRKHGGQLALVDPATCPYAQVMISTLTSRYGISVTAAWDWVHPRLTTVPGGCSTTARWLSSTGPSSGCKSIIYPATGTQANMSVVLRRRPAPV